MKERFWAKTGRGEVNADGSPKYHPVICHLADTAAVAMEIVRDYLSLLAVERLERGLGLKGESLVRFCGFLAGCHDLGKVSPAFQFQVSEVGKLLVGETVYDLWSQLAKEHRAVKTPHGTVTAATLPGFLVAMGVGEALSKSHAKRLAQRLAAIVGGHHGFFPSAQDIGDLDKLLAGTDENSIWRQFSRTIFEQLQGFVELTAADLPNQCDNAAAMLLAGLATVSDWLASNPEKESGFPYANDTPFDEYQVDLPKKARNALAKQGWSRRLKDEECLSFQTLFNVDTPRQLQDVAIDLTKKGLSPACLILIEASMGEGKTEAALYLADWLQHQASAGGFYIGLPTQATSNAMFERVQGFLRRRYSQERYPDLDLINLTLSHSAALLRDEYDETVCRLDQVYDEDKRVVASKWHTMRKRSLLSPYGVGTIDQGLMGVVRSRHQFVRLFGLAGRTVILDEIHAYDLYTSTLLERFLQWLALLGSPAIALSATLPQTTRQRLLSAYASGCNGSEAALPPADYPRITTFTPTGVTAQTFAASDHVKRSLQIRWVSDQDWAAALQQALEPGGCAAVICSTVRRAQAVYQELQERWFADNELGLFHGRFLFVDREQIEQDCLKKFGKENPKQRPHRFVLVATQVIEQSLDVDFDLMISDPAPVDLLLQRSGRLHRHKRKCRPTHLKPPTLWLIAPEVKGKADFGVSQRIYDRHVLLRSWLTLRDRDQIQLPEETDTLIEAVYDLEAPIPANLEPIHAEDWQQSLADYNQEMESRKLKANDVRIPPAVRDARLDRFTHRPAEDDDSAIAAATRLGEPSVTTIFLQQSETGLVLPRDLSRQVVKLNQQPDLTQIKALLAHSTRISNRKLVEALLAQTNPKTWTSALLRRCRYVELDAEGKAYIGDWCLFLDPNPTRDRGVDSDPKSNRGVVRDRGVVIESNR